MEIFQGLFPWATGAVIMIWCFIGLAYWLVNPELTQMQVFKHMIGL